MRSRRPVERGLWLCAAVLLGTGYYFITVGFEQKISAAAEMEQAYRSKLIENRKLISQEARIVSLRHQIRRNLTTVVYGRTPSQDMEAFLSDVDQLARAHQSQVLSLTPVKKDDALPKHAAQTLANTRLDLAVRGRYGDLLAIVAALPRLHALLRIAQMEFALSGRQGRRTSVPVVDAKIHIVLYHLGTSDILGEL